MVKIVIDSGSIEEGSYSIYQLKREYMGRGFLCSEDDTYPAGLYLITGAGIVYSEDLKLFWTEESFVFYIKRFVNITEIRGEYK